ncbi:hypothetical protein [Chryseobacterium wanjuense]
MEKIIDIQNLTFGFSKDKTILKDISLHVPKGSIFRFSGSQWSRKIYNDENAYWQYYG